MKCIFCILTSVLTFLIPSGVMANIDTISADKYFEISVAYYTEDFIFDRTFQASKIPVTSSPGIMVGVDYFYKQRKIIDDFLRLESGYCLHPEQYYKLILSLQAGTRFKTKYRVYSDILAGLSFHNSWPLNTAFNKPVDDDIRKIINRGYQKLFFEGSISLVYKFKRIPFVTFVRTDFFFSYPVAFDNYISSFRLGFSYDLRHLRRISFTNHKYPR